jgi:hypothetical protein
MIPLFMLSSSAFAQEFRTDINPALRYYQAFLEASQVSEADRQYLQTNDWRGKTLDKRFGEAVARYHYQFRLLREATHAKVPCDWGVDLSMGPEAVLPALAPAKTAAFTARHRVAWHLQHGRGAEARDDFHAAYYLARQVARDGILISALVQFAIENILLTDLAWNYGKLKPEALQQMVAAIDTCPPRGTIAQTVPSERTAFLEWLLRRTEQIQADFGGDEAAVREELHTVLKNLLNDPESEADFAATVMEKSGGTVPGVRKLVGELAGFYDRMEAVLQLPQSRYDAELKKLLAEVENHPNPIIPKFLMIFGNCRQKEFAIESKVAMVQAALQYKLDGAEGLRRVVDPFSGKPFGFRRFIFEGVDRGFELKSSYQGLGFDQVLIFVETEGPPFMQEGKNAGKAPSSR